jgi:hypothetical protein
MEEDQIKKEEMIEALTRSGYLIESRLLGTLSNLEYQLYPNETYPDPTTSKSREIDIYGVSYRTTHNLRLNRPLLIDIQHSFAIECINNPQPAVFFRRSDKKKFTIFGRFLFNKVEQETTEDVNGADFDFNMFTTKSKKFHYNQIDRCSQYCSFTLKKSAGDKKKREWMASHPDALYDTFNKLYDFIRHRHLRTDEWLEKNPFYQYEVFLNLKYPVIVLQGEIFEAFEEKGELKVQKMNHIIFEFNKYDDHQSNLLIDVVTEDYFGKYLELVNRDMIHFKNLYTHYYKDKTLMKVRPPIPRKTTTGE